MKDAACAQPGAPSAFPEDWGTGLRGRARKAQALALCRTCPVKRECAIRAIAEFDRGLEQYGIRGGIAFADLDRARQAPKIDRLRAMVAA